MKLNEPLYAIVDEQDNICGDGECACIGSVRELLEDDMPRAQMIQPGRTLAIVEVMIVRMERSSSGKDAGPFAVE